MSDYTTRTEADSIAQIIKNANTPSLNVERRGVAIFPNGNKVNLDDERFDEFPKRKRAAVALWETASFIAYLNSHKLSGKTALFGKATEAGGSFAAIIDYHEDNIAGSIPDNSKAGWGEHVVGLELVTTPEWRRWTENNARYMPQEAFAEFIEDNQTDILSPDAGTLLDVAQFLSGKKSVTFKSGKKLSTGAIAFEYTEEIETTNGASGRTNGGASIPDKLTLGIVPFIGANGVHIDARLRFRISDNGKLTFAYLLNRPYQIIQDAFSLARAEIENATGLKAHIGSAQVIAPKYVTS